MDTRRQALLAAKEVIHNAVRHSRCETVRVELRQEEDMVVFRMEDDGEGFDPAAAHEGHGIASMRSRAAGLGGTLTIQRLGRGTRLEFRVPA